MSYSWRLNGSPLPNATAATLVLTNAKAADLGDYQVVVTNSMGSAVSALANLSFSNQPPVAGTDGLLVPQGQATSVTVSTLLTNDQDPELGPLLLTSVSPTSQSGASVTWLAGQVTYQPVAGFLGSDWFTYTVADNGGETAQGRVDVLVYSGALPAMGRLTIAPQGATYRVRYCGPPAKTVQLQRSANLSTWETLLETLVPPHGIVEYPESTPPESGAYYRVRQP